MANFTTHIVTGTIVSGSLATLTLAADVIAPQNLVAVTVAGVLGSILPDIDLKDSRPSRALFAGLALFFSFVALFHYAPRLSIIEMWLLWLGTFLFVRYGLHHVFHHYTVHRGIWHSISAGIVCALATAIIFYYALDRPDGVAWLAGGFLLIGYLTHLTLDEIYSVDVMGRYIKKSFGTAMKFIDLRRPAASSAMVVTGLLLLFLVPSIGTFAQGISSRSMWAGLQERMLPDEPWFKRLVVRQAATAAPAEDEPIMTGTLPEAAGKDAADKAAQQ